MEKWPKPKSKAIGFFSDSAMYAEVLNIGIKSDFFTKIDLQNFLVNHVKGLTFIVSISETAINNLIRELIEFKWIEYYFSDAKAAQDNPEIFSSNMSSNFLKITDVGRHTYELFKKDKDKFYDEIILKLYELYVIPGWFIQRLWDLNPKEQGEIVIPAPHKNWNPMNKNWDDNKWNADLRVQVEKSYQTVSKHFPNSFILDFDIWITEVKNRWEDLALTKPRKNTTSVRHVYTPRKRLALAMKASSVTLLFGNKNYLTLQEDFEGTKPPLTPRSYSYWCTRLEELGLLNYSDYHPKVPGRIIYPVCSFKENKPSLDFREIIRIKNVGGEHLCLFRPQWKSFKNLFIETLYEEYKKIYLHVKSLYISIQDLRDSVCRILRLSNFVFDRFIEYATNESLSGNLNIRISLETDIREDQRQALQRRPVYAYNKFVSLIAITNQ